LATRSKVNFRPNSAVGAAPSLIAEGSAVVVLAGIASDIQQQIRLSMIDSGLLITPLGANSTDTDEFPTIARRIEHVLRGHLETGSAQAVIFAVQDEHAAPAATVWEFPLVTIFVHKREVRVQGQVAALSKGEFDVLVVLARHEGHVFSREELAARSRGRDYPVTPRAMDVQITEIRRKLGVARSYIQTVRGVGYRFDSQPPPPTAP
jgi:hypothetical protein